MGEPADLKPNSEIKTELEVTLVKSGKSTPRKVPSDTHLTASGHPFYTHLPAVKKLLG